jgi:hypothetical protein
MYPPGKYSSITLLGDFLIKRQVFASGFILTVVFFLERIEGFLVRENEIKHLVIVVHFKYYFVEMKLMSINAVPRWRG